MTDGTEHTEDFSRKWLPFGIAAIASLMATLDSSIVNVALPTLAHEFSADVKTVAWVSQAYILALTALLLIGGKLMDIWGERRLFALGFALFTAGSALCASAISIYMLIFARVFQALGGAILMSSNQALIARSFPPQQRGRALGIVGTVVSIGLASGPPLGGLLIGTLGWRWIFYINLPIGIIAIILSLRILPSRFTARKNLGFDWAGSFLIIIGLGALFLGLTFAVDYGMNDPKVIGLITLSMIILAFFLYNEKRAENPLIKLSLFNNRYFDQSCAAAFLAFVVLMSSSILMPFYLQNVLKFSPEKLGLFMMSMPLAMLLVAPAAGWLSDVIGTRIPATLGLTFLAIGIYSLSFLGLAARPFDIIWRLVLIGVGMGIFGSPNSNAILSSVPRRHVGVASGMTAMMRSSGITFGIAFSVILFSFFQAGLVDQQNLQSSQIYLYSMKSVFRVAALIAIVAMLVSSTRGRRARPSDAQTGSQ